MLSLWREGECLKRRNELKIEGKPKDEKKGLKEGGRGKGKTGGEI